ncbi:hypothetical protein B0H14DRAFT_2585649 [Mycena olivaceomarginata]|nr:hypothetical protein B0H14DRAFT_2585649 [Mycena olivaceomarginata]
MSELCATSELRIIVDAIIPLFVTLLAQLESLDPSDLGRLADAGITQPRPSKKAPKKAPTKGPKLDQVKDNSETSRRTEAELDKEADDRILALLPKKLGPPMPNDELIDFIIDPPPIKTQEDENRLIVQIMNGFDTAPDGGYELLLAARGLHYSQRVTLETTISASADKVPDRPVPFVNAESAWKLLNKATKGVHNHEVYMAQNPGLFPAEQELTDEQKHAKLLQEGSTLKENFEKWLHGERETLTRACNQICNLVQVERLDLRQEIQARAEANVEIVRDLVASMVVAEDKKHMHAYFTKFPTDFPLYK